MSQLFEEKAASCLAELGLCVAHDRLDTTCQKAAAEEWSYSHFLGYLLSGEMEERKKKSVEPNLQFAKFPILKRLGDFDFSA